MEVKLGHSLEDMAGLLSVGLLVQGGDEEVIHVDNQPSFSDHVSEGVIHETLEHSGGVAKAEEHDGGFKEAFVSDEGRLPLVTILDADVVVPLTNIKLGEVASIFQLVHEVGDKREGVGVAGGVFVEVTIVLAGAEFAIFLFDKEERGCLGGIGRTNLSSSQVFLQEVLSSFLFIWRKWVDFAYLRREGFIKIDFMIVGSGRGDMVGHFLREDLGEVGIFRWE